MSPDTRRGGNGNGNGNGAGGFGDFDDFIRDRDDEFSEGAGDPYDPYADYGQGPSGTGRGNDSAQRPGIDRTIVEAIVRVVDGLAGIASESLSPELRRQVESTLRDLLVVLRDLITALIERIDNRHDNDLRVEEIPID